MADGLSFFQDMKQKEQMAVKIALVVSTPVMLFTTRFGTCGSHYFLGPPGYGLVWPLVLAVLFGQHPQVGYVFIIFAVCIALFIVHTLKGHWLRWRGYRPHSLYWGESRLSRSGDASSDRRARFLTTLIALGVGVLYAYICPPVGVLVLIGAWGKWMFETWTFAAEADRLRQMEDMRIENEHYINLYRKHHGTN